MKKIFLYLCFCVIFLLFSGKSTVANTSSQQLEETLKNFSPVYKEYLYIDNSLSIDISNLDTLLKENFSETPLTYEWDIFWQSSQQWLVLETSFDSPWKKSIQLNIFSQNQQEKTLLSKTEISTFVYKQSVPLIVSSLIPEVEIEDFIKAGEELGVFVKIIGEFEEDTISWDTIISWLKDYRSSFPESSNYFVVWGEKEFLFSTLSRIHFEWSKNTENMNFVLVTWYNTSILKNYINNSIAGKNFIWNAFIIDDSLKFQILKNPKNIGSLENEVSKNSYIYTPLWESQSISPIFFISQFVNNLSNIWISNSSIYIILLLPIFLTCIWFSKHMIGISTLWTVIPIFLSILFIKVGIVFTLSLMAFLLIFNILISKFIGKYTLLYTPKVSFITILNLLVFMIFYQVLTSFHIIFVPIDDILYIAVFFIIAEKLITIITSKEFREYKKHISGTLLISLLCLMLYHFDALRVFLMAYPEILLLFIPLNFFLWRFTGLRITEYFRFREIVKSVEE